MKAAVIHELGKPPRYEEFPEPEARAGEELISIEAASLTVLARSRAAGLHYSDRPQVPVVPGFDGVGTRPGGQRVFAVFPRSPFGTMAERTVVPTAWLVPVPSDLDSVTAAVAANPGMASWVPLTVHAPIRPGESVLVHGATGAAGHMAVQVAKHLGARSVIATGRSEEKLRTLRAVGADILIPLGEDRDAVRAAIRAEASSASIGVVLDFLWGPWTEVVLSALGGPNAPRGSGRIRYVTVGSIAGESLSLPSALLRSSGIEIVGTGIGSTSPTDLVGGIGTFLATYRKAGFRVEFERHPLSDIETSWSRASESVRLVYTNP